MSEKVSHLEDGWGEMTSEAIQALLLTNAVWSFPYRNPYFRHLYLLVFLLTTLLILLPLWTILYIPVSNRPRRQWTLKQCLRVRFSRRLCALVARCEIDYLGRDLSVDLDPKTLKYSHPVTIPPAPATALRGHPKSALEQLHASRGQWYPHFVHRFKHERTKEGVWGRWNDKQQEISKSYGFEEVKAFWYTGEKATPEEIWKPVQPGHPVALHFHGGGYLCGTAAETDATSLIPRSLVKHSPLHYILSVDYRLAPIAPWPLPLLDAISAYHWLVKIQNIHPNDIILAGDSAGGHLAMALARWLRDEGSAVELKMPRGMILMSPWADLGFTNAWGKEAMRHNRDSDTIDDTFGPFAASLLLRALPASIMHTSEYISPASLLIRNGDSSFEDFPPTFIVCGGAERLSTNIHLLWDRIQQSRQRQSILLFPDRLYVSPDGVHDFMIFKWMAEEASEVYEDLDIWLRDLLSSGSPEDDELTLAESLELEEDIGPKTTSREVDRQRRLSRQMTRESLKSQKSPVMGPVQDDVGMMRMMEDMSGEGMSMIGSGLPKPHFEMGMLRSPDWLTPLTGDLRPDYRFDDDEIPWYNLDGHSDEENGSDNEQNK